MELDFVFSIIILIMSVVIHEVAHGVMANFLGDPTAKYEGRLTLNPLKHLDLYGSILVPAVSYILGGFIIGWAKPVPYNPYNLRGGRWSEALVAIAGPLSNFALALIFGLSIRFGLMDTWGQGGVIVAGTITIINIVLGVFNLIPIPPLDGSKVLFAAFPSKAYDLRAFFGQFGFVLMFLFIFFGWKFVYPVVEAIFLLITGIH